MKSSTAAARASALALALTLALATPALALFGKKTASQPEEGAPVAREIEISTYRNIPYRAQFLADDAQGEDVTFSIAAQPRHGTVTVDGAEFLYTPGKNRTGTDSFTYVATDSRGRVSAPAAVNITVEKIRSGVTYSDLDGSAAAAAAQALAERGVFVGSRIGAAWLFEPDRTVSRSEFLAMTLETAGRPAADVTITGFADDASIPAWAKCYAAAGLSGGVVQGRQTDRGVAFQGGAPVTFNEAAAILDRVLSVSDVNLDDWYAGRKAVPSWAAQAVGNMESVHVLAAGSFGSSGLDRPLTRADAAQMLCSAGTLLQGDPKSLFSWLG